MEAAGGTFETDYHFSRSQVCRHSNLGRLEGRGQISAARFMRLIVVEM